MIKDILPDVTYILTVIKDILPDVTYILTVIKDILPDVTYIIINGDQGHPASCHIYINGGHGSWQSTKLLLVRSYQILSPFETKCTTCVHGIEQRVALSVFEYIRTRFDLVLSP